MPALWSGIIGFGLVSVPIALEPATRDHDLPLHNVHVTDGGRIRHQRQCTLCGRDVPAWELGRGVERHGRHIVLTDADLDQLPLPSTKLIDVVAFIDADVIDPIRYDRTYRVTPAPQQPAKAYQLLRDTMAEQQRAGVAKVTVGTREHLALLRARGRALVLHTLYWADEVREPPRPAPGVHARREEIEAATALMERLSDGFDLDAQVDEKQQALAELIAAKIEHEPYPHGMPWVPEPDTRGVVDLMAALEASIEATEQPNAPADWSRKGRKNQLE